MEVKRDITIVIPAKNEEYNIELCLLGIMSNTYTNGNMNIIVMDNGSTDRTVNICSKLGIDFYIYPHLTIGGLRNMGALKTNSYYIAFLDADIVPSKEWLTTAISLLETYNDVGCVGAFLGIPENSTWVERIWYLNRLNKPTLYETKWLPSGNLVLRRSVFDDVGGFNGNLVTCEDLDFSNRLLSKYKLLLFSQSVVVHLGESKTIIEFFKKERWRGINSLNHFVSRTKNPRAYLSSLLPVVFILSLILSIFMFSLNNILFGTILLLLSISIPFLRALYTSLRLHTFIHLPSLLFIWFIYYIARSTSYVRRKERMDELGSN